MVLNLMILKLMKIFIMTIHLQQSTNNLTKNKQLHSPPKKTKSKKPIKCWLYGREKRALGTNASSSGYSLCQAGSRLTIQNLTSSKNCLCFRLKMSIDLNFSDKSLKRVRSNNTKNYLKIAAYIIIPMQQISQLRAPFPKQTEHLSI